MLWKCFLLLMMTTMVNFCWKKVNKGKESYPSCCQVTELFFCHATKKNAQCTVWVIGKCQMMTAKCRRHGNVTLPSHKFIHLSLPLCVCVCVCVCLLLRTYPVIYHHHITAITVWSFNICEPQHLSIVLLTTEQADINLAVLKRLVRFFKN